MNNIDEAYQQALDYLYSFIDYSLTRNLRYSPEKFNLGRMHTFMELIGNPHHDYPVIHVAGTKGKGSTAALMTSALEAAGYRVGLYTSPHLVDFTERFQVNGVSISHEDIVALVEKFKPVIEKVSRITTFELTTALCFLYFSLQKVDVAVVEVGLGGRLDATNVVDPLVSVITSISYDHVAVLGDTLAKIASEKAGIIKNGRPVVMSPQKAEAGRVIEHIANEKNARLTRVGEEYLFASWTHSLWGQTMLVWSAEEQSLVNEFIESGGRDAWEPLRLNIPLLGYHQVENAATAYAALQIARQEGISISEQDIQIGFSKVNWPGRFEVLRKNPPLILDSAHNQDSAFKLRLALGDYLPGQKVILLFGGSEDKDIESMFGALRPFVREVIATKTVHPRAIDPDELVEIVHKFGCPVEVIVPIEEALERALVLAGSDVPILVTGSLFVVAAVRELWHKEHALLGV